MLGLAAQVLGSIAAIPAVGLAFLAQRVLENFKDIIKQLSGWGLFFFACIFLVKGVKLRAAAKAPPATARAPAQAPTTDPADISVEVTGSPKGEGGFTVGSLDERAKGEVEGLTGGAGGPPDRARASDVGLFSHPPCKRCAATRALACASLLAC